MHYYYTCFDVYFPYLVLLLHSIHWIFNPDFILSHSRHESTPHPPLPTKPPKRRLRRSILGVPMQALTARPCLHVLLEANNSWRNHSMPEYNNIPWCSVEKLRSLSLSLKKTRIKQEKRQEILSVLLARNIVFVNVNHDKSLRPVLTINARYTNNE